MRQIRPGPHLPARGQKKGVREQAVVGERGKGKGMDQGLNRLLRGPSQLAIRL
jgi:hypothetical protein